MFNQAIMEFGALQCIPRNPTCTVCPVHHLCVAYQTGTVDQLPVKTSKKKPKDRFLHYFVPEDRLGNTQIQRREGAGIWRGLYEFPVVETLCLKEPDHLPLVFSGLDAQIVKLRDHSVVHRLTHQNLHISFNKILLKNPLAEGVPVSRLREFPFPAVLSNFIESHWE
jgi:A/G-specific adenine glycosylase